MILFAKHKLQTTIGAD